MATTKVRNNQTKVAVSQTTTTTVTDRCSVWFVIITGVTIFVIVTVGICVKFLLDPYVASIILISLICFEVFIGIVVLTILTCRRKKYATTSKTVTLKKNGQYHSIQPSAPQETSWQYSNRETLPA
ncbi:unnamed protein product [Psylliodes chrysocephalus]|uniref:Uncharacterized protein n=1 Tax=Psylliodes chrysocephalus TaxID=3402493 RepID=A0A9P0GFT7_9CUCU|nr:unnamed protein product [Psylliodes chrysocephala]